MIVANEGEGVKEAKPQQGDEKVENVLERMERIDGKRKMADFNVKMKLPYEFKVKYATVRAQEFVRECDKRNLNYHVSVGGLDSIAFTFPGLSQTRLDVLFEKRFSSGIVGRFRAGKVEQILGDPRVTCGDVLTLSFNGENHVFPVMSLTMKFDGGLWCVYEAFGFDEDTEGMTLSQRIDMAIKSSQKATQYAQASENFSKMMSGGDGLFKTEIAQPNGSMLTYWHNTENIENSTYIATFNDEGFGWTSSWNGGNPQFTQGMSYKNGFGQLVMNSITANKISANMINVADLSALSATIGGFTVSGATAKNGFWDWAISSLVYTDWENHTVSEENPQYAVFMRGHPSEKGIARGAYTANNVVFGVKKRISADTNWDNDPYMYAVQANGALYAKQATFEGDTGYKIELTGGTAKFQYESVVHGEILPTGVDNERFFSLTAAKNIDGLTLGLLSESSYRFALFKTGKSVPIEGLSEHKYYNYLNGAFLVNGNIFTQRGIATTTGSTFGGDINVNGKANFNGIANFKNAVVFGNQQLCFGKVGSDDAVGIQDTGSVFSVGIQARNLGGFIY